MAALIAPASFAATLARVMSAFALTSLARTVYETAVPLMVNVTLLPAANVPLRVSALALAVPETCKRASLPMFNVTADTTVAAATLTLSLAGTEAIAVLIALTNMLAILMQVEASLSATTS